LLERNGTMNIELTEEQGKELVSYLVALSDRLTKDHQQEHSGVAQFLLLSAVQGVDRLYQEIREQVEAQTTTEPESEELPPVPPVVSLVW
jgi:hypothetical protein